MHRRDLLRLVGLPALAPLLGSRVAGADAARQTTPTPDVELSLVAAPDAIALRSGSATRVWRFTGRLLKGPSGTLEPGGGSFLGPTVHLRRGQRVRVRFANHLDEPSIVHWHGLDVPQEADGHPRLAIDPGREYIYDFAVANRAGTYWYHPHPHLRTGPQVYMGLAGLVLVHDDEEDAIGLPDGLAALTCVIQDRQLDARNQFVYPDQGMGGMMAMMRLENGVVGDQVLVNGHLDHRVDVEAGWIRMRLLNASNARIYRLGWSDGRPMTVVGTDGGLLERAERCEAVTLAPAQRVDVLVDLSDLATGTERRLRSLPFPVENAGRVGMMEQTGGAPQGAPMDLITIRVRGRNTRALRLPDRLSAHDSRWNIVADAPVRRVPLAFSRMQWTLDGRVFGMDDVDATETVRAGSTGVWEFVNTTNPMGMEQAHPIHLHGRQFRVVGRAGGAARNDLGDGIVDTGWTDTVLVLPGETVRAQVTFSEHRGLYLYHCHILEHEDMGMMRNFRVI